MSDIINQRDKMFDLMLAHITMTDIMGTNKDDSPIIENITAEVPSGVGLPEHSGVYIFPADTHKDQAVEAILNFHADLTTPIIAVNPDSYGLFQGEPNSRPRHTLNVEFILDMVPGAFHQPEDLINWILTNPYVTTVTFNTES